MMRLNTGKIPFKRSSSLFKNQVFRTELGDMYLESREHLLESNPSEQINAKMSAFCVNGLDSLKTRHLAIELEAVPLIKSKVLKVWNKNSTPILLSKKLRQAMEKIAFV